MTAAVTPETIREYAGLPSEVPSELLDKHIGIATRDLTRDTGVTAPPDGTEEDWTEALTVRALASVYPWLNSFALSGAAKVGKLEGSVEYRFLDVDETEARVKALNARFDELVGVIKPAADETEGQVSVGSGWMAAI